MHFFLRSNVAFFEERRIFFQMSNISFFLRSNVFFLEGRGIFFREVTYLFQRKSRGNLNKIGLNYRWRVLLMLLEKMGVLQMEGVKDERCQRLVFGVEDWCWVLKIGVGY